MLAVIGDASLHQRLVTRDASQYIYKDSKSIYYIFAKRPPEYFATLIVLPPDWHSAKIYYNETGPQAIMALNNLIKQVFSYAALCNSGLVMHGVLMAYRGAGFIFSAPSGVGKSTHTNNWARLGLAEIINGDLSCCEWRNGSLQAHGLPWCGSSGISVNKSLPLKGIVFLQQGEQNAVSRLDSLEALAGFLFNASAPSWDEGLYNHLLDAVDAIVSKVPVFRLVCRPDEDAVFVMKREIDKVLDEASHA